MQSDVETSLHGANRLWFFCSEHLLFFFSLAVVLEHGVNSNRATDCQTNAMDLAYKLNYESDFSLTVSEGQKINKLSWGYSNF